MKRKLTILAALAGLLSPHAGAQDGTAAARRGGAESVPAPQPGAEVLKKFDKDRDGKLSESELAAWKAAREDALHKETLAKYDADKDGRLSEEETKKMQSEIPRRGDPGQFQFRGAKGQGKEIRPTHPSGVRPLVSRPLQIWRTTSVPGVPLSKQSETPLHHLS